MPELEFKWRSRPGTSITSGGPNALKVTIGDRPPVQLEAPQAAAAVLSRLDAGITESELTDPIAGDMPALGTAFSIMARFRRNGLLVVDVVREDRTLITVHPLDPKFKMPPPFRGTGTEEPVWQLSRFALLRRLDENWLLEHPGSACEIAILDGEVFGWLSAVHGISPGDSETRRELLWLLHQLGFLQDSDEVEDWEAKTWEFHDFLFHRRSRSGPLRPLGGTYRFSDGQFTHSPPTTGSARLQDGEVLGLPVPDMANSRTLADVMENRRSKRTMGSPPVDIASVAALLYRVARVTRELQEGYHLRPYPSGGAIHELGFYLAVGECSGIPSGFHHYRSDEHALARLEGESADNSAKTMLEMCASSWAQPDVPPQCLVVISSQLPKLAWKYEAIAYRLSVLGAGIVIQSLYLVAEDLGLHCCASGTGNPDLFATATGLSSWAETSVAEFGFGSAPAQTAEGTGSGTAPAAEGASATS